MAVIITCDSNQELESQTGDRARAAGVGAPDADPVATHSVGGKASTVPPER
jgi:hypothetical protein